MRFGDESTIPYEGKGDILVTFKNDEEMILLKVVYLHDLKTNILSLGKLNDQDCKTILSRSFLIVHENFSILLTKTKKTRGNMY